MASTVTDERCESRRREIFDKVGRCLTSKVFWSLFGLVVLALSVLGGWTLAHATNGAIHIHPDYKPATQHEVNAFRVRTCQDIQEIKSDINDIQKTQRMILIEVKRGNGYRAEGP